MNISHELDRLTYKDLENNKKILLSYKKNLEPHIDCKHKGYFKNEEKAKELVYQNLFSKLKKSLTNDEYKKYISSQCVSMITQINKFIEDDSTFNKNYRNCILDEDLTLITRELIIDIQKFCHLFKINLDDRTVRDIKIPSIDFYKLAKFSFFTNKPTIITNRDLNLSTSVIYIRNAIDAKIFEMIGFDISFNNKGYRISLKVTDLINIFSKKENCDYFPNIPVKFTLLKTIYDWSSEYIHSMEPHYCWQTLQAIDILEPLFSIKDRNNGSIHIHGISYLSNNIDINNLKCFLEKEMKCEITLDNNFYRESL